MSLLDDIHTKLTTESVIDGSSWTGFKSYLPDSPDQAIAILETGGEEPDIDYTFPDFQIMVRGQKFEYDVAKAKMDAVYTALHNATVSGYIYIFAKAPSFPIGYDENERPILSINFKTMKT